MGLILDEELTFSQVKEICEIIGCKPTELPSEQDDWALFDDSSADEAMIEEVEQSLWAFNADFLSGFTGLGVEVFRAIQENGRCEDNNDAIKAIIIGTGRTVEDLAEEAAMSDGRGHFLSRYDGIEHEINGDFFLYKN